MKKIVLSLAGVLAAVAFAPEASALPVFARQTGMACSACHFNHAPLLNGFGRAFKSAGYSMVGSQGKVEGEGLDIPNVVNMAVLTTLGWEKKSSDGFGTVVVPSAGGELSLFMGGRIMEGMGFLTELGLSGAAPLTGVTVADHTVDAPYTHTVSTTAGSAASVGAAKILYLPEVASGIRAGLVLDTNNGQGVAHSFEILNTGAVNVHKIGIDDGTIATYSAAQYLGTNNATTSASIVAIGDKGFINISKYEAADQVTVATLGGFNSAPLTYLRIAGVGFDVAGFEVSGGVQSWSGTTELKQLGTTYGTSTDYKATVFDLQAQGDLAGKSTGIYFSHGSAPKGSFYAQGGSSDAKSTNFGIDTNVGHEWILRAGIRRATSGHDGGTDNAWNIGAVYEVAQNVEIHLAHTAMSGTTAQSGFTGWNLSAGKVSLNSIKAEILF